MSSGPATLRARPQIPRVPAAGLPIPGLPAPRVADPRRSAVRFGGYDPQLKT